jgi:cephalosporin hydroxylase
MALPRELKERLEPRARRFAKNALSSDLLQPYYRRVGRKFGRVYHNQGRRTWEGRTTWMGVRAEKLPLDLWTAQEIIFETRPTAIIETGVRRGGSAYFYAHLFDLLGEGEILGIDIDMSLVHDLVREHPRVTLLEADSAGDEAVAAARAAAEGKRTMIILDSDHSAQHVLRELDALGDLVSEGCYLVVEDTNLRTHPTLWQMEPGPGRAIDEWLPRHPEFVVDPEREKFLATFNPGGYLKRLPS